MSPDLPKAEIIAFLTAIETGEIVLHPEDEPQFVGSGNVQYSASNGWKIVVFSDANFWDYLDEIITDDGRKADYNELKTLGYSPSQEIAWRRYRIPNSIGLRCSICQQIYHESGDIEHIRGICAAWMTPQSLPIPIPEPSAAFSTYLAEMKVTTSYVDVKKQSDFSLLSRETKMLTVRFWLDNEQLPALPDGLTHLALFNYDRLKVTPKLPAGLKALTLAAGEKEISLPKLPEGLESLCLLNFRRIENLENLPKGLKVLAISSPWQCKISELPSTLEQLELNFYDRSTEDIVAHQQLENLHLPHGLRKLALIDVPIAELPNLPTGLKELAVVSPSHHFSRATSRTYELHMQKHGNGHPVTVGEMEISKLPRLLEVLRITSTAETLTGLPDKLRILNLLYCCNLKKIESLPDTLEKLNIIYAPELITVPAIPKSLESTHLYDLPEATKQKLQIGENSFAH